MFAPVSRKGWRAPGICRSKPIDFSKRSMDKTNLRRVGDKSKPCGIFMARVDGFEVLIRQRKRWLNRTNDKGVGV